MARTTHEQTQLVVGLGSGRSGTTSLAKFLDAQPNAYVVHEGGYTTRFFRHVVGEFLPWEVDIAALERWHHGLSERAKGAALYGDVGASFLPYVPHILEHWPQTKFVCLKRDRQAVIESFMHITPGVNSWSKNSSVAGVPDFWDAMHPDMQEDDKEKAIGKYWDMYYEKAAAYAQRYPHAFAVYELEVMNTRSGRDRILDFIGMPPEHRNVDVHVHANSRYPKVFIWVFRFIVSTAVSLRRQLSRTYHELA